MTSLPTLLVAEDDQDMAFLICSEFHKIAPGWNVCHATNGQCAKERLREAPVPKILITDLQMPLVDGFELIEWVRGEQALDSVYIMVFSNSDAPADRRRCEQLHSNGFTPKAVSLHQLRETLRSLLQAMN